MTPDYIFMLESVVGAAVTFSWINSDVEQLVIDRAVWEDLGRPTKVTVTVKAAA